MATGLATAGQRLTAAFINSIAPLSVIKPSNQSVTSSTVLVNDSALFVPVVASATYIFAAYIDYEGGTAGSSDIKFAWSAPSGAGFRYAPWFVSASAGLTQEGSSVFTGGNVAAGSNGAGVSLASIMLGSLVVGATGGNLQFKWAQNTSSATATIVHAQSMLALWRIT